MNRTKPSNRELPGVQNPTGEFWYRLQGETWQAYEAFACYRDMGGARSLKKVASKLSKNVSLMGHWSSKHDWQNRIEAFDRNEEFERMMMLRERRYKWIVEDLEWTEEMQEKLRIALGGLDPKKMSVNQIIRAYDVISRRQEKILGLTPEQMEEQLASQASHESELERLMDSDEKVRDAVLDYLQRESSPPDIG